MSIHLLLAHRVDYDLVTLERQVFPLLTNEEKRQYKKFRALSRRQEWLLVRFLLYVRLHIEERIGYDSHGRPLLANSEQYLSISHSKEYVAVCLSERPCGVDIDSFDRRYSSLRHRFLSEQEFSFFSTDQRWLALAWCAKEAMYKLLQRQGVIFARDMVLYPPKALQGFGYFYGRYVPESQLVRLYYYKLTTAIITIAVYVYAS